jgi:hypothetical protein
MKKKCLVCNKEFEPYYRGSEQKYCSVNCRNIAAQERNKQKIIQGYENKKTNYNRTSVIQDIGRSIKENSGTTEDRIRSINNLKLELALKEIEKLKIQINMFESEL